MRKKVVCVPVMLSLLVGCGVSQTNTKVITQTPTVEKSTAVELTVDNFSKYVAVNTSACLITATSNNVIYYSYFIGADYFRFNNCTVTYKYKYSESLISESYTVPLTFSGDGQALPYSPKNSNYVFTFTLISTSGTVERY